MRHVRKLKPGQIIRVHEYGTSPVDELYVVIGNDVTHDEEGWYGTGYLIAGAYDKFNLSGEEFHIETGVDTLEYLTKSQIPDHVWAGLGKWALTCPDS